MFCSVSLSSCKTPVPQCNDIKACFLNRSVGRIALLGLVLPIRASSFANGCEPEVDEHDDHIEVNGVIINKPFVEKQLDADDHNIA